MTTEKFNWENPDPFDSGYWLEITKALSIRRIPAFYGLSASCRSAFDSARLQNVIVEAIYASVEAGDWRNEDNTILTWRKLNEDGALIAESRGTGSLVSSQKTLLKSLYSAIPILRYKTASFRTGESWYYNDDEPPWPFEETIQANIDTQWGYNRFVLQLVGSGTPGVGLFPPISRGVETIVRDSSTVHFISYYATGDLWITDPIGKKSRLLFKTKKLTSSWSPEYEHFDTMGTEFVEGMNIIEVTSPFQRLMTQQTPPVPPTENTYGEQVFGWKLDYALFDYGSEFLWEDYTV